MILVYFTISGQDEKFLNLFLLPKLQVLRSIVITNHHLLASLNQSIFQQWVPYYITINLRGSLSRLNRHRFSVWQHRSFVCLRRFFYSRVRYFWTRLISSCWLGVVIVRQPCPRVTFFTSRLNERYFWSVPSGPIQSMSQKYP
jgi:hypothetical protein